MTGQPVPSGGRGPHDWSASPQDSFGQMRMAHRVQSTATMHVPESLVNTVLRSVFSLLLARVCLCFLCVCRVHCTLTARSPGSSGHVGVWPLLSWHALWGPWLAPRPSFSSCYMLALWTSPPAWAEPAAALWKWAVRDGLWSRGVRTRLPPSRWMDSSAGR